MASAGLAAAAVACAVQVLAPDPPPTRGVVVTAHDLPAGARLDDGNLRLARLPPSAVPGGAVDLAGARGRVLAAGARAGEVLTDARLLGPGLLTGQPPGLVGAPVRVADPAAAALVAPGDRVDVLLATEGRSAAQVVVREATVLAAGPRSSSETGLLGGQGLGGEGLTSDGLGDGSQGGLLVLAVPAEDAAALAGAAARGPLLITVR